MKLKTALIEIVLIYTSHTYVSHKATANLEKNQKQMSGTSDRKLKEIHRSLKVFP